MKAPQRGVAIVLAMGVAALAAIAATAMMITQSTWAQSNQLHADHRQAQALVPVGIDWTRALLSDDRRRSSVDTLMEPWALQLPPIPLENGSLGGRIEDQQGRFNLNNVVKNGVADPVHLAHFRTLLALLGLSPEMANTLGNALVDWIDRDNEVQLPDGAEDAFYLSLPSPRLAANQPLPDVAELVLVRGFDAEIRHRLNPYVSALPVFTAVNVNTAPAEVLAAVIAGLDLDAARALVAKRDRVYLRNLDDLQGQLPTDARAAPEEIAFGSNYFLVQLRVSVGNAQAKGTALLARTDANWPAVLWRKM